MPETERSRFTADTAHPFVERLHHMVDRGCLAMRHRDAWSSATAQAVAPARGFEALRGHKVCLLTTYRKSGEPVPTPVWFGLADGKLYMRTEAGVGKVKRMRSNPRVRVAPCTMRGRPLGPPTEGLALLLPPSEWERAEGIIAPNYGLFRNVLEGTGDRLRIKIQYVEVVPADAA